MARNKKVFGGSNSQSVQQPLVVVFIILAISCILYMMYIMSRNTRPIQITNDNNVNVSDRQNSRVGGGGWGLGGWGFGGFGGFDTLTNPYVPPYRPIMQIPINQPTNIGAVMSNYNQVGILTAPNIKGKSILPLMGRMVFANRDKWQFYTMSENGIKLPVIRSGKSCTSEYGCDNIYNGDTVYVEGLQEVYKATIYDNSPGMSYLPLVI